MGESLLVSGALAILKGLIPLAEQQVSIPWGFEENLKKLHQRLTMIHALLCEAAKRRTIPEPLKVWLKSLDAVTSDAENLLDELKYEDIRRKVEVQNRKRNKVRDFFSPQNQAAFHIQMANKVNAINLSLDDVCKLAKEFGLNPADHVLEDSGVNHTEFRLSVPYMGDSVVVGRENDVSKVIEMLRCSDVEDDLSVFAIVGMAGLGKTTLAKLVYNHENVKSVFGDQRIWICVSDNFDVELLLNQMVGNKSKLKTAEQIVKELGEKLNGKRFLLVLDDVWNRSEAKWECMRDSLLGIHGSKGSKIIVTTRDMDVASIMQKSHSHPHRLFGLTDEESLNMFRNKVFGEGGIMETESLLNIGQRMVTKCKGVPLAINALGGILGSKKDENDWLKVEKTGIWSSLEDDNDIRPVLRLSFEDLASPSLKQCFAYCSVFPKDKIIEKDNLIQMWMALGYLQPSVRKNLEAEDVGNNYFNVLLHRSLFQESELDEYGKIKCFKMHDLVHDLALDVSGGDCLTLEHSETKEYCNAKGKHLWLDFEKKPLKFSIENVEKVRTLFSIGYLPVNTKDVKSTRVLSLAPWWMTKFPSFISKFIHLKYLDLSECFNLEKVPDFTTKLYNLETLILPYVKKFPKKFHKLASMRYLSMRSDQRIPGSIAFIRDLTSLRMLTFFVVGKKKGHKIEELERLSKLRGKLEIYNLQHVKDSEEARKANMLGKPNIQELLYHWENDRDLTAPSVKQHEEILEGLQPQKNLKVLRVSGFGGLRFASWMRTIDAQSLQNLVRFELKFCRYCERFPPLGHLPCLEIVKLKGLDNVRRIGSEFYGLGAGRGTATASNSRAATADAVFPSLRKLALHNMRELEEWSEIPLLLAGDDTSMKEFFPRLEDLSICFCPRLRAIPAFKNSTSLQELKIEECPELMCLPKGLLRPSLVRIDLSYCAKLKTPNPDPLCSLTSLKNMKIMQCPNIGSGWKEGLFCSTSLESLTIGDFGGEYTYFPWPPWSLFPSLKYIGLFPWPSTSAASPPRSLFNSLKYLYLYGWPEVKSLPDQLEHLPALRTLEIRYFEGLESLPKWLSKLSSLEYLRIYHCPLLKKRCEKEIDEDLHKIAHIPTIEIDNEYIQRLKVRPLQADEA